MGVTLSEEQERAAQVLADAGLVKSKEEAITLGLEWMQEQARKLEALRAAIAESDRAFERGDFLEFESGDDLKHFMESLKE